MRSDNTQQYSGHIYASTTLAIFITTLNPKEPEKYIK